MTDAAAKPRWPKAVFVAPLAVFALLGLLFAGALRSGDPSRLPSALIGKPAPQFDLRPLAGLERDGKPVPGFSTAELTKGDPAIVTVWASWCGPCVQEQPTLVRFRAQHNIRLFGINYK